MASKFGDVSDGKSRFSDCTSDPQEIFPPIQGFEDRPLVTLEEAVKPLTSLVEQVNHMVWTVKKKCNHSKDRLSQDESASIMLYTLEWTPAEKSFYFILNATLRSQNRRELIPWFLYLRLFICALSKLPPSLPRVIYRGVKMDLSNDYSEGNEFIWWSFSSCTSSIGVLENHIGKTGRRTIFNVILHSAKDISQHSFFETEREYLLYPARQFKVSSILNTGNELHIIELEETRPLFRLIPIPETPLIVSAEKPKPSILSVNTSSNASSEPNNSIGQGEDDEQNPDRMHSSSVLKQKKQNDYSSSPGNTDETNEGSSFVSTIYRHGKSIATGVLDLVGKKKEKDPTKSDPNDVVTSDSQLKYVFNKYSKDDQVSYLLGPVKRRLVDDKHYQIFPSGYCRLTNTNQEKEIEQSLHIWLPITLKTDRIQLPNDDLAFFISTSAAEKIFERDQLTYSIISKPYTASFSIEVINAAKDDRTRSRSLPSRKISPARLPAERDTSPPSISDGKFRIPATNSSIGVICGDITEANVDLMVCVSTSRTLLRSVLSKAGPSIASQYEQSRSQNAVLLDGGFTSARNILFISWMLKVKPPNSMEAQNSLSDLVKRCIQQALKSNMTSIAFPSIGTDQIGLDPHRVCEAMISAASERLHKCKMDVLFVIYPSSGSEQKSYQIFRTYLDDLCKAETPSISHVSPSSTIAVERIQHIDRSVECKRISTVSNSSDMAPYHQQLVKSLEKLIKVKKFDLSLVQKPFLEKIESLIDICLDYHVLPHIDLVKGDLILRGDRDSCSQCFANLQNPRTIHRYVMFDKTDKKSETKMNVYVSMKIDEAITNNKSYVNIEDNNETIFHIDLKALNLHINDGTQNFDLYNELLNGDSKIVPPKSWSFSSMIRIVEVDPSSYNSLECVLIFEETMLRSEWYIERVDAIENWPLYVHYNNKKSKDEIIAFHGCSFSSVQSIIHYGLHSNRGRPPGNLIHITYDALYSHIRNTRRSTDGKHYMFVLQISKKLFYQDSANLTNENAHLALPTYLIVYRRETIA